MSWKVGFKRFWVVRKAGGVLSVEFSGRVSF